MKDPNKYVSFEKCITEGKICEALFSDHYLTPFGLQVADVTNIKQYQKIGADFIASLGHKWECKGNYRDNLEIIIEDWSDYRPEINQFIPGWFFTSTADVIVSISKKTVNVVGMKRSKKLVDDYNKIKNYYRLIRNDISYDLRGNVWRSAFRVIPCEIIKEHLFFLIKPPDDLNTNGKPIQLNLF
jgi:hypothetical protein